MRAELGKISKLVAEESGGSFPVMAAKVAGFSSHIGPVVADVISGESKAADALWDITREIGHCVPATVAEIPQQTAARMRRDLAALLTFEGPLPRLDYYQGSNIDLRETTTRAYVTLCTNRSRIPATVMDAVNRNTKSLHQALGLVGLVGIPQLQSPTHIRKAILRPFTISPDQVPEENDPKGFKEMLKPGDAYLLDRNHLEDGDMDRLFRPAMIANQEVALIYSASQGRAAYLVGNNKAVGITDEQCYVLSDFISWNFGAGGIEIHIHPSTLADPSPKDKANAGFNTETCDKLDKALKNVVAKEPFFRTPHFNKVRFVVGGAQPGDTEGTWSMVYKEYKGDGPLPDLMNSQETTKLFNRITSRPAFK